MNTPLPGINIEFLYFKDGKRLPLPRRMGQCTPDTKVAVLKISKAVEAVGGRLFFSDMFRSYDMPMQSHLNICEQEEKSL